MNSRKIPNVIIVIGKVSMINIGFTISRNKAMTTATTSAVIKEVTLTPGSKYPNTITAKAVRRSLISVFILVRSYCIYLTLK